MEDMFGLGLESRSCYELRGLDKGTDFLGKCCILVRSKNPRPMGVVMWDWLRRSRMGLAEGPLTANS